MPTKPIYISSVAKTYYADFVPCFTKQEAESPAAEKRRPKPLTAEQREALRTQITKNRFFTPCRADATKLNTNGQRYCGFSCLRPWKDAIGGLDAGIAMDFLDYICNNYKIKSEGLSWEYFAIVPCLRLRKPTMTGKPVASVNTVLFLLIDNIAYDTAVIPDKGQGRPKALCYEDILLIVVRHPEIGKDVYAMAVQFIYHEGADNKSKPRVISRPITIIVSQAVCDNACCAEPKSRRAVGAMRHGPKRATLNAAYINEMVEFNVQNAALDKLTKDKLIKFWLHMCLISDPRASSKMVPSKVRQEIAPDPETEDPKRLWFSGEAEAEDKVEDEEGYVAPAIGLYILERAELANLLVNQPGESGDEELLQLRIRSAEHMILLNYKQEMLKRKRIQQRALANVACEHPNVSKGQVKLQTLQHFKNYVESVHTILLRTSAQVENRQVRKAKLKRTQFLLFYR
ncbi:FluG domain-containing protein [Xylaria grammica]|nr:FluG domain-containing protein [Xylaria grammica]